MLKLTFPGPEITTSLHNHSKWSDGQDNLETVVKTAKAKGLRQFGISDHWVMDPSPEFDSTDWSMKIDLLPDYIEDIHRLQAKYNDDNFTFLAGLEVDYFDENFEQVKSIVSQYPLDYIIGSGHYVGTFSVDNMPKDWEDKTQDDIDNIWRGYWEKLEKVAASGFFTFLAHLDIVKKFAHYPSFDFMPMALKVLDAAQASQTAIELNTSGWQKPCAEEYPSPQIIREAIKRRIPIVINADAHYAEFIDRDFQKAKDLIALCSSPQLA